ncbi:MAG: hypothetical protein H0U44_04150 [Flavisolibacter sp.]|nr:hypothetical protein [Flavisolibacter sp.]
MNKKNNKENNERSERLDHEQRNPNQGAQQQPATEETGLDESLLKTVSEGPARRSVENTKLGRTGSDLDGQVGG